jgi:signal transduction histidine kinase
MTANLTAPIGLLILWSALYLLVGLFTLRRSNLQEFASRILGIYVVVLVLTNFGQLIGDIFLTPERFSGRSINYGLLISSILLLHILRIALAFRTKKTSLFWWGASIIWLGAYIVADGLKLPFSRFILTGGWAIFMGGIVALVAYRYRQSPHVLTRRQLLYWVAILIPTALANVIWLAGGGLWGEIFRLMATIALVYILTTPQLPDFIRTVRQMAIVLVLAVWGGTVYVLAWFLAGSFLQGQPAFTLMVAGIIAMVLLAVLFQTLRNISEQIVNRIFPIHRFDTNRILREYSLSLSNVLEPERLASVAVGLISEAIEVRRGILILVQHEQVGTTNGYRLRGAPGMGMEMPSEGFVDSQSPIATHFATGRLSLTQYDMDFSPAFSNVSPNEQAWFAALNIDLYVPIFAKEEWIGLLALGSKEFGRPYMDEDITLLRILADQTAVALQNARLVESLTRINNDYRRAYSSMEQSNRQLGRANAQLQKLDRAKTDFIAIASHELKTPLTVMRGYTEMLQDDPTITDNTYYKKMVDGIHSGISRFQEIVDSMLDIAMIDNSTLNLNLGDVSLDVLLRIITGGLRKSAEDRQITLSLDMQSLPPVEGDPEALRKVFYHLIINAIKYTPDGGKVTVSGQPISANQASLPDDGVEIVIADTGIGIDPEYQDLIFVKFYQTGEVSLHSSGKTKFKGGGPGLGLTIAKGIVDAHSGRIWVESSGCDEEKCPGSKFHVVLPIHHLRT